MSNLNLHLYAGETLRGLIKENYATQEDFAFEYGLELRTVSRYINQGIKRTDIIEDLADFFDVSWTEFFPFREALSKDV